VTSGKKPACRPRRGGVLFHRKVAPGLDGEFLRGSLLRERKSRKGPLLPSVVLKAGGSAENLCGKGKKKQLAFSKRLVLGLSQLPRSRGKRS